MIVTEARTKINQYLTSLKMNNLKNQLDVILIEAEKEQISYQDFFLKAVEYEFNARQDKALNRRLKQSNLDISKTIENFDFSFQPSISKKMVKQILAFEWLEQAFNLIFLGPPGVGKSHLATAIGLKAVDAGYKVIFISMEDLIFNLKTKDAINKSLRTIKRLKKANLIIIDEIRLSACNQR